MLQLFKRKRKPTPLETMREAVKEAFERLDHQSPPDLTITIPQESVEKLIELLRKPN